MPVDPRIRDAILETFALATGGEPIAVESTAGEGRVVMRSRAGDLLVLTTGDLPLRPDLDTDDLALLVELCNAWLRVAQTFRETGLSSGSPLADAAIMHTREKIRAAL